MGDGGAWPGATGRSKRMATTAVWVGGVRLRPLSERVGRRQRETPCGATLSRASCSYTLHHPLRQERNPTLPHAHHSNDDAGNTGNAWLLFLYGSVRAV